MTPDNKKLLEELGRSQYGKALREFLENEIKEIENVRNVKTWKETEGRQIALRTLDKLFYFMGERPEQKKTSNQYI